MAPTPVVAASRAVEHARQAMSLIRVLVLSLACAFAAQATGMLELVGEPACCDDGDCPDENANGVCPPSCGTCVAKVLSTRLTAPLLTLVEIGDATGPLAIVECDAPDGVHSDVFHPPRA